MSRTDHNSKRIPFALVIVALVVIVGRIGLRELRIRNAAAVTLYFADDVELDGWYFGSFERRLLHRLAVPTPLSQFSDYAKLQIQVGDWSFPIVGLTEEDLLAAGAKPVEDWAGHYSLSIRGDYEMDEHLLMFEFADRMLQRLEIGADPNWQTAPGLPALRVANPDNSTELTLPCSGNEAMAFFGQPKRKVFQGRSYSVTVDED